MAFLSVYILGVLVGLAIMRDAWVPRIATALLWPLGPIAFVVVVPILLIASAILWPLYVLPFAVVFGMLIWFAS